MPTGALRRITVLSSAAARTSRSLVINEDVDVPVELTHDRHPVHPSLAVSARPSVRQKSGPSLDATERRQSQRAAHRPAQVKRRTKKRTKTRCA